VELMERLTSFPWGSFTMSAITTAIAAIAIFAFGAPAWILLPVTLGGATLHLEMRSWVERQRERRG
jgi:hypothetical protein